MGIPRVHLLAAGLASFMALKFRFFGDSNGESTLDHASGAKLDGHALAFLVISSVRRRLQWHMA